MRRILVTVLAASALALAACGSDTDAAPAGGTSAAAGEGEAAATASACGEAVAVSKTGASGFDEGVENLLKVALEGDEAKTDAAEKEFRAVLTSWSDKLTELSGEPVAADVKAALTEGAATVKKIADPDDNTPVNAAKEELAGVADKIGAACA
ncbi:hypothetical protein Ais01nite_28630 [Asanoa ishikariensis]|uniref:Secreted protein n=1 Tax=Asanoa ishikariensis TaxID=137265 RepID=A0A1H3QNR4_9ACTN|nr:hypothetical protein [Asanoa ishikariensis]GIF64828.1 hypothetical protein Ais01nite_28630 [Asanoa ishikariensis]SDZ15202.1 hypothetical protein SAMN05421684_3059 [Asanoa ishikariensis]